MAEKFDSGRFEEQALAADSERYLQRFAEFLFSRRAAQVSTAPPAQDQMTLAREAFEFFFTRAEDICVRAIPAGAGAIAVETMMPDCPFIVDSLIEYFGSIGAPIRLMLHPIVRAARSRSGQLVSLETAAAGERPESFVHSEIELPQGKTTEQIAEQVRAVLGEAQLATGDFHPMTARALEICDETARDRTMVEAREFLRWMAQGGFVFLGYRRYRVISENSAPTAIVLESDSGLGILRDEQQSAFRQPLTLKEIDPARRKLLFEGSQLIIRKTRAISLVHHRRTMDDIAIRRTGADGRMIFDRFLGLFTSKAYAEEAQHTPVLRTKLAEVIELEHVVPGSHDYKELVSAFNSFPKEELFRASATELLDQLRLVLDIPRQGAARLSIHADPNRGNVIVLVLIPRDRFSADVRVQIQETLTQALGGPCVYYYLALGESLTARLHFCFAASAPLPAVVPQLENQIAHLMRSWEERLADELAHRFGEVRSRQLRQRWLGAFSAEYKAGNSVTRAAEDVDQLETMLAAGTSLFVEMNPHPADSSGQPASELRIFESGEAPILSELMPALQNLGLRVLSEHPHDLRPEIDGKPGYAHVQIFLVEDSNGRALDLLPGASMVADALAAVRTGLAEDDALNALTLTAGLPWREVALLRAYVETAFQMRLVPSRPALRRVLMPHPALAATLVELFKARLDPERTATSDELDTLRTSYLGGLAEVDNIADDRAARMLLAMVEATVRTNFFHPAPAPDPYIALKFQSAKISNLPDTAPLYEIHVNSPRMQGCHLRAGEIARGGIRLSDRPDDYRTEILDLMETQTVKNAIIVPVGAKGGFIVKPPAPNADPEKQAAAYATLINALLDLTDNIVDGAQVHPERVKVLDTDGAYLVVAADKGTASYSDLANSIAQNRGFWLGDAFASGGAHGYDHKQLGVTARGAWESATHHLREMGRDLEHGQPITMAGIGDMSGDVFGNGLLLSDNVKLIAAFDHRHIFLDPNPDPRKSFAERRRLFETPGSQWTDYDASVISAGGGVFRRGLKTIALSDEIRAALGCEQAQLDSDSLIQAILRAPVDMLYNGGIGTYVRASTETDAEVGDHANDSCRITAPELRARIVVEGGNLGFTQKARIEYALAGGRINTDATDNSAGVDASDHEVNLKILLQAAVARGSLSLEQRNTRIAAAGPEVVRQILRDNRDQVFSLSLEQIRSSTRMLTFREHLSAIEQRGLIRLNGDPLPAREALRDRRSIYPGLTRPELSVVTAYTKIDLAAQLQRSPLTDDPYLLDRFLRPYFPPGIAHEFAAEIPSHRLRRELIAARMVNELVDVMGSIFIFSLTRDYGVETVEAMRAWVIAADVLGLRERVEQLRAGLSAVGVQAAVGAFLALERPAREAAGWIIRNVDSSGPIGAAVERLQPAVAELGTQFESWLQAGERDHLERSYRLLRAAVEQESLAHGLARMAFARHLLNVCTVSSARDLPGAAVGEAYFWLSQFADFALLDSALDAIGEEDRWEQRAAQELTAELDVARLRLCNAILADSGSTDLAEAFERIRQRRRRQFDDAARVMAELRLLPAPGLPALQVAVRTLDRMLPAG